MTDTKLENMENLGSARENLLETREIQPATPKEIQGQIGEAYNFAKNADEVTYRRGGGADLILVHGRSYAELPGFSGKSPREIIESLPSGSTVLDVGCGYGQLGAEILGITRTKPLDFEEKKPPPINSGVKVFGFDAQAQKGQDRLTRTVIGSIDDLSPKTFAESPEGFDLVISSSVLYHLPDYWGGILRMARVLKPKGLVLASTMPRVISHYNEAAEDTKGFLKEADDGYVSYYRDRNVFDTNGRLIPPGEVIDILNRNNQHFRLEYGVASTEMVGAVTSGGQISGQRLSREGNLDISCMFYCLSKGKLGYILAQTPEERLKLQQQRYVNLHDRLNTK